MNNTLRQLVLFFLQKTPTNKNEQFNEAFDLYRKSEGRSYSTEVKMNRIGYSEEGLQNLLYDLQKLHGITDAEVATVIALEDIEVIDAEILNEITPGKELLFDENPNLNKEEESAVSENAIPLREEFAFLDDPKCPEILLVVVGKKISAHKKYQALHAKLQEVLAGTLEVTEEEQAALAYDTQEAFSDNLALWDELNYYATNGELLGKHPLFRETVAKREVDSMTVDELAKYRTSSATFISKKNKELKSTKITDEKKQELETAIAEREYKLELVNAKMGVNVKK